MGNGGGGIQIERLYSTVGVDLTELHTGLAKAKADTRTSTTEMAGSWEAAGERIEDANVKATRSMGTMGRGASMLGIQLGQASQQLMGGANAAMVFAQQGPDIAFAMSGATGALGRMSTFMLGPWGAAIFTGISVLGMLGLSALEAGDDMDEATAAADRLAAALENLGSLKFTGENATDLAKEIARIGTEAGEMQAKATAAGAGRGAGGRFYQQEATRLYGERDALLQRFRTESREETNPALRIARANEARMNAPAPTNPDRGAGRAAEADARRAEREAEQEARAQERADEAFRDALERSRADLLQAQAKLAVGADAEAGFETERINAAEAAAVREIEQQERWSEEKKAQLIAIERTTRNYERIAVAEELAAQQAKDASDLQEARVSSERDFLKQAYDMATTAKDRREIALQLVELDYQLARIKLDEVIASTTASEAEKERARILLASLNELQPGKRQAAASGNLDILSAEGFGERLGQTLEAGILDALKGKNLKKTMSEGLTQFLHSAIDESFNSLMSLVFGKGGSGGFLGALLSSITGGARAVGGPVLAGHAYNVGMGEKFIAPANGRVLSRADAMAAGGGGAVPFNLTVKVDGARGNAEIMDMVSAGVQQGIAQYDRVVGDRVSDNFGRRGG